ncbi:MAG TPA: hypothetical protein VEL76_00275 [Gemmataceae bacterium]|nr:hypothetical protein [Gemmataceae bacterium]
MTKRLVVQGLSGTILILLVYGVTYGLLAPFPGISEANCDRIRPARARQKVERLLQDR